ncbi:MAG TPA: beta-ketoacyl synthase N-terminal-like domain-containing protein [Dehalococcoidia bacterium]|nr:beta-ketoacyl synthase N-terminal-like domain-containing protein [Dehalococcoidia bacterium]
MPEPKRVCITGIGVVSPFGRDAASLWDALTAGRSAIAPITSFDASSLACRIAGEVRDYSARDDIDPEAAAQMDRRTLFAADAAIQALLQAEIPITAESTPAIGVAVGCELPEPGAVSTAMRVARTISAGGPVTHLQNAAPSGLMAIGEAAEWIRREDCAVAVAGGTEAPIEPRWLEHFDAMVSHANDDPAQAVRPYDTRRDGFALSEGAAMLVLEDEDLAVRRAATILGYVDGYGASFNRAPVAHPAANPIDVGRAMQAALMKWDVTLQGEIDVIFGAAGGNVIDAIEGQAIARVWGPNKDKLWVTAIKGGLGHTLGASGAFNAVTGLYCLQSGLIPPTLNLDQQAPDAGELEIVTGEVRRLHGSKAMVNAFGLGANASLILSRP